MSLIRQLQKTIQDHTLSARIFYLLIFLFPILGMSVRHWLSLIFVIIALFSLILLIKNISITLCNEEKVLFYIFAAMLVSFTLSAALNGWTENSYKRIGTELKYLMFFPIYLMIARKKSISLFLLSGVVIGGIVLGLQGIYDRNYHEWHVAVGKYGPIAFGDLSILFFSIIMIWFVYLDKNKKTVLVVCTSLILAVCGFYFSGRRTPLIAFIVIMAIIPYIWPRKFSFKRIMVLYLLFVLFMGLSLASSSWLQERVGLAIKEYNSYFETYDKKEFTEHNLHGDSVGFRLEQWRSALNIFPQSPIFGFGAGNAGRVINEYVKQGKAHQDLYNPKAKTNIIGLHSVYFETLITEGLVGFIILLLFLFYPFYIFIKYRKYDPLISSLGIVFMINYMIFGLTENPFTSDNGTSVFLIFLAILFSSMITARYPEKTPRVKTDR